MHGLGQTDEAGEEEGTYGLQRDAPAGERDSELGAGPGDADGSREGEGHAHAGSGAVDCCNGGLGAAGDGERDPASSKDMSGPSFLSS